MEVGDDRDGREPRLDGCAVLRVAEGGRCDERRCVRVVGSSRLLARQIVGDDPREPGRPRPGRSRIHRSAVARLGSGRRRGPDRRRGAALPGPLVPAAHRRRPRFVDLLAGESELAPGLESRTPRRTGNAPRSAANPGFVTPYTRPPARGSRHPLIPRAHSAAYDVTNPGFAAWG